MKVTKNKKIQLYKTFTIFVLFIALGFGIVFTYNYAVNAMNPIPEKIRKQIGFSPLIIRGGGQFTTTDYELNTAEDKSQQILLYKIKFDDNVISVSESSQPPQFIEIPEYKDRSLDAANRYDSVPTSNGVIYLCRGKLQNDKQLGIMLEKGLLIFMYPSKELSKDQWRSVGDNLEIQKN